MKVNTAEIYSILGFIGGAALSKSGCITLCYYLSNPEPYTLDKNAIKFRQNEYERALKFMPPGSFFHKSDVFLKKAYDPATHMTGNTFLERAEMEHFAGRMYLEHHCVVAFTLTGLESLAPSYEKNPVLYRDNLVDKDKARLAEFMDAVEGVIIILKNLPNTGIRFLEEWELKQFIVQYVNGFPGDTGMRDVYCGPHLEIGEARAAVFAVCEENTLPDELPEAVEDDTIPKANAALFTAPLEKLGLHLRANHIINHIIWFEGHTKLKGELQARVDDFHKHRRFAKEVALAALRLEAMQKEVLESQAHLCRAHISVIVWDKDVAQLEKAKDTIREIFKMRDIGFYQPTHEGLYNIFLGSVIGRENKLARSYFFMTELAIATGLLIHHSPYKDDAEGILYNDRIYQIPLRLDTWDEKKHRIPARNGLYIASTGGGKSSTCLNAVDQDIQQKTKVIAVEFGRSFWALTKLHPTVSAHIDYDNATPLGVNPFYVATREEITSDKLKTLTVLVLKFWRQREIVEDTKQYVSLTKIIKDYYQQVQTGHSFPDFYLFIKHNITAILERQEIPPAFFDVDTFLHNCSEFMPNGVYENVCKMEGSNEDIIREKDFIVFELTKIKKDPFLVSVIMTIIFDTVENKILANRSIRGKLYLDEYAETATLKDNFSNEDVHSTVAFFFQKLRKENGGINAIIQSPAQLPDNNFTRSIIANCQLLYVLPTTETVYYDIIQAFRISNESHIQLMKSIRNDFSGERPYAEVFIRFGDLYATVVRLEFSKEKYYAFQTDGKDWQALDNLVREGFNMEEAINKYIKSKHHEKAIL
jgi:conjugal transfer ATP-binding protein TraC